jgi:hypothetical protein
MARKTEQRKALKPSRICIIGEGKTEFYYFSHLRSLYQFNYEIKPHFFRQTSIKEINKRIIEVIEGDAIAVCVFDADVSERNEKEKKILKNLCRRYESKENVIICDSLPSIEFWFLLHYSKTNKYFMNSKSVEKELRKFINQYEKKEDFLKKRKWVDDMCNEGKLESAKKNAESFSNEDGSYSNIYRIFKIITSKK